MIYFICIELLVLANNFFIELFVHSCWWMLWCGLVLPWNEVRGQITVWYYFTKLCLWVVVCHVYFISYSQSNNYPWKSVLLKKLQKMDEMAMLTQPNNPETSLSKGGVCFLRKYIFFAQIVIAIAIWYKIHMTYYYWIKYICCSDLLLQPQ